MLQHELGIMTLRRFLSDEHAPADAFDAYRDLYGLGTDVARIDGAAFHATVAGRRYPRMVVFDRTLAGLSHERTARRVDNDGFDHFTVQLVVAGNLVVDLDDTQRIVPAGQFVVFDTTRPQRTLTRGGRFITLSIAREAVERTVPIVGAHGRVFAQQEAPIVRDLLLSLASANIDAESRGAAAASSAMGLCLEALLADGPGEQSRPDGKLSAAMVFIRHNVGRHDLSADLVAREIGVSRSVLYRLFEPYEGVARTIKRQRLLAFRRALAATGDLRPISTLARVCGFVNDGHANRSFHDEFGEPPGAFRSARRNVTKARPLGRDDEFAGWFDDLV